MIAVYRRLQNGIDVDLSTSLLCRLADTKPRRDPGEPDKSGRATPAALMGPGVGLLFGLGPLSRAETFVGSEPPTVCPVSTGCKSGRQELCPIRKGGCGNTAVWGLVSRRFRRFSPLRRRPFMPVGPLFAEGTDGRVPGSDGLLPGSVSGSPRMFCMPHTPRPSARVSVVNAHILGVCILGV